jgi:hypothetical protein
MQPEIFFESERCRLFLLRGFALFLAQAHDCASTFLQSALSILVSVMVA